MAGSSPFSWKLEFFNRATCMPLRLRSAPRNAFESERTISTRAVVPFKRCIPNPVQLAGHRSEFHSGELKMSDEKSRPTCPFKVAGPYVPPRFQQGPMTTALNLGPLAFLAGSWRGPGFNAIWRPDNPESDPIKNPPNQTKRLLELNLTNDSFDFHVIPGVVPNRGLNPQTDLSLYGLHYLQRTSDADPAPSPKVLPHGYSTTAGQALHIEPGLFMNVPASIPGTTPPGNAPTIVRMGSIPHGVTVLMQGPTPDMKPRN